MAKHRLLQALLILCVLAFAGWYVVDHLEWREETVRSEQSAEARANPHHAGLLLLRRLGHTADFASREAALDALPPRSTLMLSGLDLFADPERRQRLLNWVRAGGHLVLPLETGDKGRELLRELQIEIRGGLQNGGELLEPMMEKFGADLDALGQRKLIVEGQTTRVVLHDAPVFRAGLLTSRPGEWLAGLRGSLIDPDGPEPIFTPSSDDPPDTSGSEAESCATASTPLVSSEDAPEDTTPPEEDEPFCVQDEEDSSAVTAADQGALALYARFSFGKGMVTAGSFSPFITPRIGKLDHAALFTRLLTLPDGPRPLLMLSLPPYPGLMSWLAERAPEALFVTALLLLAALRRVMPRFGPLLPPPSPKRPGLREHLAASGHFLLRQHCYEALLAPLRDTVSHQLDALQHRHPEIEGRERLGEHLSGIKAAEIQRALSPEPATAHEFLRRARTLATLRQHCRLLHPTSQPGAQA